MTILTKLQEKDYAQKLFLKIFFILTLTIALANLLIYFLEGEVPILTQVQLLPNHTWILPHGISSWWTIVTGAFVASLISILWYNYHNSESIPIWKITIGSIALGALVYCGFGIATAWVIALIVGLTINSTVQNYVDDYFDKRIGRGDAIAVAITIATASSIGYQGFFGLLLTEVLVVIIATLALIYFALCEVHWYQIKYFYYDIRRYLKRKLKAD